MKLYKYILFFSLICFLSINNTIAQNVIDTTKALNDTKDSIIINTHSPHKATIYSLIIPGGGQIYNKKYWKLPIIYAGFGALAYFISVNSKEYNNFKTAYKNRTNNVNDKYENYSLENLRQFKNYYRGNIELSIMLSGVLYFLNVIDANVDAHFFYYDVSEDLTINIRPELRNFLDQNNKNYSLTLTFKF
ncbi:MAG: hypothetical protein A2X12_11485 [Bacteroidetes bacterium GWE2_29_8]|nr:MAG: hypothetical protein A2X12_11485 [Bacteroidetes bacterium GWE2_29_8]OFY13976.1 MAG: hypothetical protein A2X02_09145 [Bacteroidetes bacterium GWF2_29_10]